MSYGLLILLGEMTLRELRHRRSLSQQDVAESMNIPQSGISKIERRKTDARIARIRRYLEAMDIKLHLVAELPDGECFEISQFEHD